MRAVGADVQGRAAQTCRGSIGKPRLRHRGGEGQEDGPIQYQLRGSPSREHVSLI